MRVSALLLLLIMLGGCATSATTDQAPAVAQPVPSSDEERQAGEALPGNATVLAVYLPSQYRKSRVYVRGFWITIGKALQTGVVSTAQHYFPQSFLAESDSDRQYGLLLAIEPEWKFANNNVELTFRYKVFSKNGPALLTGQKSFTHRIGNLHTGDGILNASVQTTQMALQDLLTQLKPTPQAYPAKAVVKELPAKLYVNTEKPVSSGTGFFINAAGEVLTAHHVLTDCALVEVRRDAKVFDTRQIASSALLDLAVVDTGEIQVTPLPLRKSGDFVLGEPVANVGYPLQSILSPNPTLTRGNISSRGGLKGSIGQFQFSAPIQPGSSGGPVVSDEGELLGVTLSTLSPKPLIDRGILPQNVNFALEARYVAQFLNHNNIKFVEMGPNTKGDMQTGNQAALAAVVSVACYQ
jgi:S1-C subfamily serine protease